MVETGPVGVLTGMRIAVSALVGAAVAPVAMLLGSALIAPALRSDGGAVTFLVWTWLSIGPMSAQEPPRTRPGRIRPARWGTSSSSRQP